MENKEYDIYDIVTGKKIEQSQVIPGKTYIIYYLQDKWKVRSVVFDENFKIIKEKYISREDREKSVADALYQILERQGCTDINISNENEILEQDIRIRLDMYQMNYRDKEGRIIKRILDANTLKDIITVDKNNNKTISVTNAQIEVGGNNNQKQQINQNKTKVGDKQEKLMILYCNNCKIMGSNEFGMVNAIVCINGQDRETIYDLRTQEGVEDFKQYVNKQREAQNGEVRTGR